MRKLKYKIVKANGQSAMIHSKSPYCLSYVIGSNTIAPEGTQGIMVFKTLGEAVHWWERSWVDKRSFKVFRVSPIGDGFTPKFVSYDVRTVCIRMFNRWLRESESGLYPWGCQYAASPISGTMCYPAVYVDSEVDHIEDIPVYKDIGGF